MKEMTRSEKRLLNRVERALAGIKGTPKRRHWEIARVMSRLGYYGSRFAPEVLLNRQVQSETGHTFHAMTLIQMVDFKLVVMQWRSAPFKFEGKTYYQEREYALTERAEMELRIQDVQAMQKEERDRKKTGL